MFTLLPELTQKQLSRFETKYLKGTGCWIWTGSILSKEKPYGQFWVSDRNYLATRIMYKLAYKIDPKAYDVCHKCNNPICVNPTHLELGTASTNLQYASVCGSVAHLRGSTNPASKLTEAQVKLIKQKLLFFVPEGDIAKEYKVDKTLINQIKRGIIWRHVS